MKTYKNARRQKQANTIKGEGNPNWKGGQITKSCIRCGSPFQVYPSQNHHTHCSLVCANRDMADAQKGISNKLKGRSGEANGMYGVSLPQKKGVESSSWKGGITLLHNAIRTCKSYNEWRLMVFGRDGFVCQECGKRGCYLEAHHKKSLMVIIAEYKLKNLEQSVGCRQLWDIDNGITLCKDCHKKTDNFCGRKSEVPSA